MWVLAGVIADATGSSADVPFIINSKMSMILVHSPRVPSYAKKPDIVSLFSREAARGFPGRATISLRVTSRGKEKRKPLLTFGTVTQTFVVYPERPEPVSRGTLIKL